MSDVPEVEIKEFGGGYHIVCGDGQCKHSDSNWTDALSLEDADYAREFHLKWHEDGMPE